MARSGDTFTLHDGEKVTIRTAPADSGGDLLELDAEWAPAGAHKPPLHFHPKQAERFEIHDGELTVKLEGERHVLRAGDTLEVPRGAVHAMWNSGDSVTRATWQVRPALGTEDFFAAVHAMRAAGASGKGGMITAPAAGMIFSRFPDEFRLAMPGFLWKPAVTVFSTIGRLRRYPKVQRDAGPASVGAGWERQPQS
jgi:mannose-6-phosphate isomerase-like protein (cupin superfamily)